MTDTMGIVYHNNYSAAYYFIDDVSLVDCTGQGVQELGIKNEELGIYPNPATQPTPATPGLTAPAETPTRLPSPKQLC